MILIFIFILLSVAFITIGERKIMASMQRRIGPNYVGYYGLLQAISDAIKLLLKEIVIPQDSNKFLFILGPLLTLIFSLLLWGFIPISREVFIYDNSYTILMSLAVSSLSVYGIVLAGWSSNSKYALLGSLRSVSQLISYEIVLTSCIILVMLTTRTLNFIKLVDSQQIISNIIILFPVFIIFMISILAETNRTPFDLPEAESELVSGFNTEHSASVFVFFFLAEYSNILYWSTVTSLLFFKGNSLLSSFFVILFIWIRATLPRLKYNQLLNLCWSNLIPWVFSWLILFPSLIWIL